MFVINFDGDSSINTHHIKFLQVIRDIGDYAVVGFLSNASSPGIESDWVTFYRGTKEDCMLKLLELTQRINKENNNG